MTVAKTTVSAADLDSLPLIRRLHQSLVELDASLVLIQKGTIEGAESTRRKAGSDGLVRHTARLHIPNIWLIRFQS